MKTLISTKSLGSVETPLLALIVAQGSSSAIDPGVERAVATGDYKGKKDETLLVYGNGRAQRILLVGIGKTNEITRTAIRRAAAIAAKRARGLGTKTFSLAVAKEARGSLGAAELAQVLIEGVAQGGWQFTELKKQPEDPKPELESVELVIESGDKDEAEAGRRIGDAIAAGYLYTRNLQMQPGNVCTPSYLAEEARKLAATHGFKATILDKAQIKKEGMGALLAVSQGSAEEPRFIVLEYGGGSGAPVALIGKGVTFDSGGISIKPAANMEDMKFDKSGATAVLGVFEVLGRLKPKINVVGLIPATENLPSGTAVKPGDVVKSHLGKTIEIINTDAEGRLILCDALSYARRFKPVAAIDVATLTGAVVIALGHHAIGMLGNDEPLLAEVRDAGERAGERCWPLPLWDDYRELLKSDVADVKNSGGRAAGTIAGAWFLREFVDSFPWVHLDIAGTAYLEAEGAGHAKGPTAVGVRLFTEFLLKRAGDPGWSTAQGHALHLHRRLHHPVQRAHAERPPHPHPRGLRRARRLVRRTGDRLVRRPRARVARDLLGRHADAAARPRLGLSRSGADPARPDRARGCHHAPRNAASVPGHVTTSPDGTADTDRHRLRATGHRRLPGGLRHADPFRVWGVDARRLGQYRNRLDRHHHAAVRDERHLGQGRLRAARRTRRRIVSVVELELASRHRERR
jgi:leucyl aminopeptidase